MNDHQCPNCKAGLEALIFVEHMVHYHQIDPNTGQFTAHTIESDDENDPYFCCDECGLQTRPNNQDDLHELLDLLVTRSTAEVAKVQAQVAVVKEQKREARSRSARQKLEDLRQQYQQETGFLPPRPRTSNKKRKRR